MMSKLTPAETVTTENTPPHPLWRNLNFILLWSGQAISTLGTSLSTLALPLLVLALTHSPAVAGLLTATRLLPYLIFSLPVGALIDRWNRKIVMISCDVVRWLVLGAIPLLFVIGYLNVAFLYSVAFIEGTAYVLFSLAQISSLPRVVHPTHLPRAYAFNETSEYTATLLGPVLSTFLISLARTTVAGAVVAYLVDSISYLVSVLSLSFIRVPFQIERVAVQRQALWKDIGEGLRFLWGQHLLRVMAVLTMTVNFLLSAVNLAVIVLLQNELHVNVFTIGLLFSLGGIGGLLSGFIAAWVKAHLRFGLIIIGSVLVWSLATLLLATALFPFMIAIGLALINGMWPIYAVVLVSYRLEITPDRLQGRVNSAFRFLTYGSEPLGAAIGGLLLASPGPRFLLGGIAAGLALCVLLISFTAVRKA